MERERERERGRDGQRRQGGRALPAVTSPWRRVSCNVMLMEFERQTEGEREGGRERGMERGREGEREGETDNVGKVVEPYQRSLPPGGG